MSSNNVSNKFVYIGENSRLVEKMNSADLQPYNIKIEQYGSVEKAETALRNGHIGAIIDASSMDEDLCEDKVNDLVGLINSYRSNSSFPVLAILNDKSFIGYQEKFKPENGVFKAYGSLSKKEFQDFIAYAVQTKQKNYE